MGTGVRVVSFLSGSARNWTVGATTPRMKSTSETRTPHVSASRRQAKAPSRIAARRCSGIASCRAHTCSVVATYALCLPAPGDVRREHGDLATMPS